MIQFALRTLGLAFLLVTLSGCALFPKAAATSASAIDAAAKVYDAAVHDAGFLLCVGASIGSLDRAFPTDEGKAAHEKLCDVMGL